MSPTRLTMSVVLALPFGHVGLDRVVHQCRRVLAAGHSLYVYALGRGVHALRADSLQELRPAGAVVWACAAAARSAGVPLDGRAEFGGLSMLAEMVDAADGLVGATQQAFDEGLLVDDWPLNGEFPSGNPAGVMVEVRSDPFTSEDAAEACRMVAGVVPWSLRPWKVGGQALATTGLCPERNLAADVRQYLSILRNSDAFSELSGCSSPEPCLRMVW